MQRNNAKFDEIKHNPNLITTLLGPERNPICEEFRQVIIVCLIQVQFSFTYDLVRFPYSRYEIESLFGVQNFESSTFEDTYHHDEIPDDNDHTHIPSDTTCASQIDHSIVMSMKSKHYLLLAKYSHGAIKILIYDISTKTFMYPIYNIKKYPTFYIENNTFLKHKRYFDIVLTQIKKVATPRYEECEFDVECDYSYVTDNSNIAVYTKSGQLIYDMVCRNNHQCKVLIQRGYEFLNHPKFEKWYPLEVTEYRPRGMDNYYVSLTEILKNTSPRWIKFKKTTFDNYGLIHSYDNKPAITVYPTGIENWYNHGTHHRLNYIEDNKSLASAHVVVTRREAWESIYVDGVYVSTKAYD